MPCRSALPSGGARIATRNTRRLRSGCTGSALPSGGARIATIRYCDGSTVEAVQRPSFGRGEDRNQWNHPAPMTRRKGSALPSGGARIATVTDEPSLSVRRPAAPFLREGRGSQLYVSAVHVDHGGAAPFLREGRGSQRVARLTVLAGVDAAPFLREGRGSQPTWTNGGGLLLVQRPSFGRGEDRNRLRKCARATRSAQRPSFGRGEDRNTIRSP